MGDTGRSLFDPSHPVTVPPAVHYGENSTRDLELLVGNLERALPGDSGTPKTLILNLPTIESKSGYRSCRNTWRSWATRW